MRARRQGTPTPGPGVWAGRIAGKAVGWGQRLPPRREVGPCAAGVAPVAACQAGLGASLARGRARFEIGVFDLVIFGCGGGGVVTDFAFSIRDARCASPYVLESTK